MGGGRRRGKREVGRAERAVTTKEGDLRIGRQSSARRRKKEGWAETDVDQRVTGINLNKSNARARTASEPEECARLGGRQNTDKWGGNGEVRDTCLAPELDWWETAERAKERRAPRLNVGDPRGTVRSGSQRTTQGEADQTECTRGESQGGSRISRDGEKTGESGAWKTKEAKGLSENLGRG
ncbi:hypothetical protein HNY73_016280 [Argiope bruennichi]|uniref:Uncharacterized protein n=1 Tax=Argiope bruennichi TaxID=94029 RepID=A0A8T0EN56_ARGBR|nr:hypothetical protein HNY73_016280 [Argiope bruennichi]